MSDKRQHTRMFLQRHPVTSYLLLTFAISWGGFMLVVGPDGFSNPDIWQGTTMAYAVMAMLSGPAVSGLLMTGITDGKLGYKRLVSRLLKWRADISWYAFALLAAPVLSMIPLLVLSLDCPIFTAQNKAAVLVPGVMAGLTTIFEEIGWTGYAVLRLRRRHSVFRTGLMVGIVWGSWHLLQQVYISGTYAGGVPHAIYFCTAIFNTIAGLTAYRILLVWLYDRTGSLLLTTLMHASLTACNVFIFRPEATGSAFLVHGLVFTSAQWALVAAVTVLDRGSFMRNPIHTPSSS